MWTKGQIVDTAFEELALAGYTFDLTPDEKGGALRRLDAMMATWDVTGIRLGYAGNVNPDSSSLNQASGLPDWSIEAVYMNLAIRLANSFGKQVPKSLTAPAKQAYDAILARMTATPIPMQPARMVAGAGFRRYYQGDPFLLPPRDYLTAGPDSALDLGGPVPLDGPP